jgi:hypothetical protein
MGQEWYKARSESVVMNALLPSDSVFQNQDGHERRRPPVGRLGIFVAIISVSGTACQLPALPVGKRS